MKDRKGREGGAIKDPRLWKVIDSKYDYQNPYFSIRSDRCWVSEGKIVPNYYVLETQDWVNIVPITAQGEIILIEQYRHGLQEISLEVPGGVIDTHKGETPEQAAIRELREETGFEVGSIEYMGKHHPNPAIMNNTMFTYLALNCKHSSTTQFDAFEDIKIRKVPLRELPQMIRQGEINHSIIMASLFLTMPHLGL